MVPPPRADAIVIGGQLINVQHGLIEASSSGNTAVIAAQSGKKIRIISYTLMGLGDVNARFQSSTTNISGRKFLIANIGISCGANEFGWMETAAGEALNLNLSADETVEGELTYIVY